MKQTMLIRRGTSLARLATAACLIAGFAARADDGIKVYRLAKTAQNDSATLPAHPPMNVGQPSLKYKTPAGWTEVAPGEMRVASFSVHKDDKQADVGVFPLPGAAGGDVANVNRWRGQVGLEPLSQDELKKTAEVVKIGDSDAELFNLAGANAAGESARILGAILHRDGTAWFFKMTGDDVLVAENKSSFIEFLKSVQFGAPSVNTLPPSHPPIGNAESALPAGHPDISTFTPSAEPVSREGQPKWQVPSGWNEVNGGQFLVAKFLINGDANAQAAVNVSMSAGDAGGLESNVNRWRGQLGLSQQSPDEINKSAKKLKVTGGEATLVEMSGTDARSGQPAKLVGVMVPRSGETWFYKLMGDSKLVDAQHDAFVKFVTSTKY